MMEIQTVILLIGLVFNFCVMVTGGITILFMILRYNLRQENRMATVEEQLHQLMRSVGLTVRECSTEE